MLRTGSVVAGLLLAIGGVPAEAKDFDKLLKGDYAFTGEATCLVSFTGFNANQQPNAPGPFPHVVSFSVHGVRTFNGDGTGKVVARVVSMSHPVFNRGGVSSTDIQSDFTYTVSPDLKVAVETPLVTGTVLTGGRAGETLAITNLPPFSGFISEDLRSLTLAHDVPGVEDHAFSNGDVDQRICHRSRVLFERKNKK